MKLPADFIKRMQLQLGEDEYRLFEKALAGNPPVSVRLNSRKLPEPLPLEAVPYCKNAYFLDKRPLFSSDPLWHAGAYYVQEAGSMLLEQVFLAARSSLKGGLRILDLCGAPGGKSTHLASLCGPDDVLVSNEVIRSRLPVLAENLRKQGYPNTIITSSDSSDFEKCGEIFDVVLVDAPCSGEGLFRKDPAAAGEWNPGNVKTCELRQRRILDHVVHCLKPGGILIYSTCTYNPGENEDQAAYLCRSGFEPFSFFIGGESVQSYNCMPHRFKGEGFFITALRKQGTHQEGSQGKNRVRKPLKALKASPEWMACIEDEMPVFGHEDRLLCASPGLFDFFHYHLDGIYCYALGCELGSQKDKLFQPSEYLPFSLLLRKENFPMIELDTEKALKYIFKNPLPHAGNEKGYTLLGFKGIPIGFGKFAGNRINNLFPSEWKLRQMPPEDQWFCLTDL